MTGCLQTRVRKQPIIALYFESENETRRLIEGNKDACVCWSVNAMPGRDSRDFCLFCVDALHPSQQFFSHVGTFSCLPRLNQ